MSENKKTSIGGQAVIEGVLMRGKASEAIAVRAENGEILVESKRLKPQSKANKIPIIRGAVAFFSSLVNGTKALMRSASVFGEEESTSFDNWLSSKLKINAVDIATFFGVALGLVLSLLLFFFVPQLIADLFTFVEKNGIWYCLIEGLIRITIFVIYVLLTSLIKDVKRTYMYHGAEHKTISCYEQGKELTVSNVKTCSRLHDRCGTTFMFIVMIISIVIFALVNALLSHFGIEFEGITGKLFRFLVKLLTLPFVAGISYEVLKLLSKTKSKIFFIFKLPGLLLQRITTREPSDDMIEVAITSFNTVLLMDSDPEVEEKVFNSAGTIKNLINSVNNILIKGGCTDTSDGEWIVCRATGLKRSELSFSNKLVTPLERENAINFASLRAKGMPLAYVFGDMDFYGFNFKVNSNVLIPRPETEELVMHAIKEIGSNSTVLDLCSGSGAIGITVNLKTGAFVTLLDVSDNALAVAKENANLLNAKVSFTKSNMFDGVKDKFDCILSNPPYIPTNDIKTLDKEVQKEPILALDGGVDGLDFYKIIAKNAYKYLNPNGFIMLELGINQAQFVKELFDTEKYSSVEIISDINGIDRFIKVRIYDK